MANKIILIDAAHREETRVAVLENGILQDFDREAIAIKQIKGNIYLAKVTRVEPSLQAAFVDYGSDRHGFLPFADIHPDYYQLSESERQKLREINNAPQPKIEEDESEEHHAESEQNEERRDNRRNNDRRDNRRDDRNKPSTDSESEDAITTGAYSVEDETAGYAGNIHSIHRRYNIQDVIKPGQLILVQVSKEERGNKGASMTTFVSIAGKYCVLMTNTPNRGGVSKKVENFRDRKLLRSTLNELAIPSDRSIIIRTAGVGKRPEEIKRDSDYLNRLWDNIKSVSDKSKAPSFIHAEDDVIKRCIRDVYNDQINEVIVEGKDAYETIIDFVTITSPSTNNNVKLFEDRVPIFNKYRVEQQISDLYEKQIQLPSGGSIVIDHTEALVAIDVNSGRATKESGVEETAFNTNMEAVKEIARQLRLRDLAGLVVIDFIDMYESRHRRNVERAIRDALQHDRARIQLGRISPFGLLEMSRQRLGSSFFETITEPCKHCSGTGYVRSAEILAVSILRAIRHACSDKQTGVVYIYTTADVIAYMMNYKKDGIIATEKNYQIHIFMHTSDDVGNQGFSIKKRKSLSDEERRELEMEVTTGKVNKMGLEKSYLSESSSEVDNRGENQRHQNQDNRNSRNDPARRRGNDRNRRKGNNSNDRSERREDDKKSLIGSVLSIFSR